MSTGIPYGKQEITEADIKAVTTALTSDFLTQGPRVEEFEKAFAQYVGAQYAVAVANGTAALHLAALALGVNNQSRVITTPITFAASANCIRYCGGTVEFADIDPSTGIIDIAGVEKMISAKPKGYYQGIIPVDFAGIPVNTEALQKITSANNMWIIEDACHAPGAYFTDSRGKQQLCGNNAYGDISIFSFHPVKHIATGEGGMITTNDPSLFQKLMMLRTHGITKDPQLLSRNEGGWYYEMQDLGFNYRIPDVLCALGTSQLAMANQRLERRIVLAKRYDEAFSGHTDVRPLISNEALNRKGIQHAYHLYVIRTKNRLKLYNDLRSKNIFAQVHYIPVYQMPYYRNTGFASARYPHSEEYYSECLSIPMYPSLKDDEQQRVIASIFESIENS
jgi:UDP-4-amino-4,6-dideoxy-N-acetyl-beta-L-altrosamine transaminase